MAGHRPRARQSSRDDSCIIGRYNGGGLRRRIRHRLSAYIVFALATCHSHMQHGDAFQASSPKYFWVGLCRPFFLFLHAPHPSTTKSATRPQIDVLTSVARPILKPTSQALQRSIRSLQKGQSDRPFARSVPARRPHACTKAIRWSVSLASIPER